MPLTKVQQFMLFGLGKAYEEFEQQFSGKPMMFTMSKTDFIELVHKAHLASKKDRAVYKNLQSLEEQKYISYENKTLQLTKKGAREYDRVRKEVMPYLRVNATLTSKGILSYTSKNQTVLK